MAAESASSLVRYIHHLASLDGDTSISDADLLDRFTAHRDEGAFSALVSRYGCLVLAVCRRVVGNEVEAEDAFQATFLVLALKASQITDPALLANWLHGVAYFTARNAKIARIRRQTREQKVIEMKRTDQETQRLGSFELSEVLDEELARLPAKLSQPIILCELQGLSRKDAAQRLNCPEGTLSSRLARARQHLLARLLERGFTLSAGGLTVMLSQSAAEAAVTSSLLASTVRLNTLIASTHGLTAAGVPVQISSLATKALKMLFLSKLKLTSAALVLIGVLAGAGLLWGQGYFPPAAPDPQLELASQERTMVTATQEVSSRRIVTGRVLDPDGKPVPGARLFALKVPATPKNDLDLEIPERGVTKADGSFRIELPSADVDPTIPLGNGTEMPLVAIAPGFGMAWANMPRKSSSAQLTIRLVKDQPIQGRIITTEGKPVGGVQLGVIGVSNTSEREIEQILARWKIGDTDWQFPPGGKPRIFAMPLVKVLPTATTGADGKFQLTGIGAGRMAMLSLNNGPAGTDILQVLAKPGFDPAPYNVAAGAAGQRPPGRGPEKAPVLYGPSLDYVIVSGRTIEGTVRDSATGKPVPGIVVTVASGSGFPIRATSDAQGRYRLTGLPNTQQHALFTLVDTQSAWLRGTANVQDNGGVGPMQADIRLARGVIVKGRVVDKQTGKGVPSGVRITPLPDNQYFGKGAYASYQPDHLMESTDADGRFRVVAIPGKVVVLVQAKPQVQADGVSINPYRLATIDQAHKEQISDGVIQTAGGIEVLGLQNACSFLDLSGDQNLPIELFVDPGKTAELVVQDPDGKPLSACRIAGVSASWPSKIEASQPKTTIFGLASDQPRKVAIYHSAKKLGAVLEVRGGQPQPVIVRLAPVVKMKGRLLEENGSPLAGARINLYPVTSKSDDNEGFALSQVVEGVTDDSGKFSLEGALPGLEYRLSITQSDRIYLVKPKLEFLDLKPGENRNLGDLKVEPRSPSNP